MSLKACNLTLMAPSCTLQGMNLSVESLHATMMRVRGEVLQPYATMRVQTMQMGNLHRTSDVLRHVLQRLQAHRQAEGEPLCSAPS